MTRRPGPRSLCDDALSQMLAGGLFGTLATVRHSGHPHLSTMVHHWDPDARVLRFSTTADRVKAAHLRRDPPATEEPAARPVRHATAVLTPLRTP
ncbi:pyridoxamine 5'-phosphate oxidase family protein [Streptomyces sp. NPDC096105]|uniref:pyridoxamine 5'-phosphate oxidase family protein n=1 Tax=Streptomyces sp. NPDC096105 TaxID=3366074 RepID=UPI00382F11CE